MGFSRKKPAHLGEKLRAIREKLGLSLAEMADKVSIDELFVYRQQIHSFEKNEREPSLLILLRYSQLSKVSINVFADDALDLPDRWQR